MGIGASLAFIAIGAILAFATDFTVSGINIQMIGLILILVGLVSIAITFTYVRPRRRAAGAELVEEEPLYLADPENAAAPTIPAQPQVVQPAHAQPAAQPVQLVQPVQPVQPVQAQPVQPTQAAQPVQSAQPVQPNRQEPPTAPIRPDDSATAEDDTRRNERH